MVDLGGNLLTRFEEDAFKHILQDVYISYQQNAFFNGWMKRFDIERSNNFAIYKFTREQL